MTMENTAYDTTTDNGQDALQGITAECVNDAAQAAIAAMVPQFGQVEEGNAFHEKGSLVAILRNGGFSVHKQDDGMMVVVDDGSRDVFTFKGGNFEFGEIGRGTSAVTRREPSAGPVSVAVLTEDPGSIILTRRGGITDLKVAGYDGEGKVAVSLAGAFKRTATRV